MIIGFSGCHRSGKTHAAKIVAERLGYEFVITNVSDILAKHPNSAKSFGAKMKLQLDIIAHLEKIVAENEGKNVVFDRTPNDLMVYALDMYTWKEVGQRNAKMMKEYLLRCDAVLKKFDFVVKVDLLDEIKEASNKGPTEKIYMTKLDCMFDSMYYHFKLSGSTFEDRNTKIESMIKLIEVSAHGQ